MGKRGNRSKHISLGIKQIMKNNVKRQQQHQQKDNSTIMNIANGIDNTNASMTNNSQQISVDENNSISNNNNAPQHLEMESSSFDDIDLDLVDDVESNVGGIGDYTTDPIRNAERFYYCLPMMVQYRYAIMFISFIFLFLMVGIGLLAIGAGGGADPMIVRLPTSPATAPTPTDEEVRETMGTLSPTTPFPSPAPSEHPADKSHQQQWFQTNHPDYVQLLNTHDTRQQSHLIAGLFCNEQGLHLCNYNEYCPDGKMNAPANGGPLNTTVDITWNTLEEVQWAPINSATNIKSVAAGDGGWVQVGHIPARDDGTVDNGYGICWTWDQWAREDEEDLVQVWNVNHRQWILCCPQ